MTEDRVERDLAARFQRLRDEDDSRAPAFLALYEAARRNAPRRDGRKRKRTFALIAAAAAIPIVIAVFLHRRGEPALIRQDANAIAAWKSPTESLLDTPGSELYGEAPPVADPIPPWILESKGRASTPPALSTPTPKGVSS